MYQYSEQTHGPTQQLVDCTHSPQPYHLPPVQQAQVFFVQPDGQL